MKIDIERIHEASLKILREIGVKFEHPDILKLMEKYGIRVSGQIAYFTEPQIMAWIQKAPGRFTQFARNPKHDVSIGGDTTVFAAGYGATFIVDANGAKRNACLEDYVNFLKLVQVCDPFSINGGLLVQPADVPHARPFPLLLYQSILHSDKGLMGGSDGGQETQQTMDLLSICFGNRRELIEKPRMMSIINSSSPLRYNRDSLDKLIIHAQNGQPALITAAVMGGTTGPITLAGTMAQANAETLSGIAVSQMIREGAPAVYGTQSTLADMRSGAYVLASPEHALCLCAGARLAKFYGLPCRGGGGKSDAGFVSSRSGSESMLTMLTTCTEGMNVVILSAGILDSAMAMSYEKFLLDLQIIAVAQRVARGVEINEQTLAMDAMYEVGPGGEYLTHDHTLNFCRAERWPTALDFGAIDSVITHEDMMQWLQTEKLARLNAYHQPDLAEDLQRDMKKYLIKAGFEAV
jgi:trimethylamine--corrinoid protein Co-methyltransferase